MKIHSSLFSLSRLTRRTALAAAVVFSATALTACYVVPVQPDHPPVTSSTVYVTPAMPVSTTFAARLYPANDAAKVYGMVGAVVTNDMNGRGTFTTNINGESFTGEATRIAGSPCAKAWPTARAAGAATSAAATR